MIGLVASCRRCNDRECKEEGAPIAHGFELNILMYKLYVYIYIYIYIPIHIFIVIHTHVHMCRQREKAGLVMHMRLPAGRPHLSWVGPAWATFALAGRCSLLREGDFRYTAVILPLIPKSLHPKTLNP